MGRQFKLHTVIVVNTITVIHHYCLLMHDNTTLIGFYVAELLCAQTSQLACSYFDFLIPIAV